MNGPSRRKFSAQRTTHTRCNKRTAGQPQQDKTGRNGAKPENVLKPQRNCEKYSKLTHRNDGGRDRPVAERRNSEEVEVEKHVFVLRFALLFPPHKDECRDDCDCKRHRDYRYPIGWPCEITEDERGRCLCHPPAVDSAFDESKHESCEHDNGNCRTNHINTAGTLCNLRFRDEVEQTGENDDAERRVDEEGPAPREVRCQPAAENGTDGNHSANCGTPHGKRDSALFALEVRVDERERCGQHHGATYSLNNARKDEDLSRVGGAGPHR